jgi:hypothetical protein
MKATQGPMPEMEGVIGRRNFLAALGVVSACFPSHSAIAKLVSPDRKIWEPDGAGWRVRSCVARSSWRCRSIFRSPWSGQRNRTLGEIAPKQHCLRLHEKQLSSWQGRRTGARCSSRETLERDSDSFSMRRSSGRVSHVGGVPDCLVSSTLV